MSVQAVLPTDFFLTDCFTHDFKRAGGGTDDNPARHLKIMRSGGDYTMERFKETGVMMTPMLAATSNQRGRIERFIRHLYELGADFKSFPADDARSMHERVIRDPLYQLIKYQIRDVQPHHIKAYRAVTAAVVAGDDGDQKAAEGVIAENLARWKPLLDEVLEPDNEKTRPGQVPLAVSALANSARVTVLPIIVYLVETARYDINQRLPAPDTHPMQALRRRMDGLDVDYRLHATVTQHVTDFFRSNYAGLLTLLQIGARYVGTATQGGKTKNSALLAIAQDAQSTHMSRVNMVLKRHIRAAEELVAKQLPKSNSSKANVAAECLKTELAEFCRDKARKLPELRVEFGQLRVTEAYLVDAVDERLSDEALLRVGLDVPHVRRTLGISEESFKIASKKAGADKASEGVAKQDLSSPAAPKSPEEEAEEKLQLALEKIRSSLRSSIVRFFSSLTERPVYGGLVTTGAAALDLVYKALICRFADHPASSFDVVEDVLEPLLQALLKAQNEYGWAMNSCAPGSISFVVAVLEGRLDLAIAEEKKELPKKAKGEDRYAELLAYLEGLERDLRDPTPQNLEAIRAAAVEIARSRPSKKEETTKTRTNRTQKKGGNEGTRTHLSKQETLRKILDVIIVDPDAFDYAMNELRGLFFAELLVKYDDLLADRFNNGMNERRSTSHRPSDVTQYREPEFISERMSTLLAHLCRLADVFARSFLLVVEDIPRVFGLVLDS